MERAENIGEQLYALLSGDVCSEMKRKKIQQQGFH